MFYLLAQAFNPEEYEQLGKMIEQAVQDIHDAQPSTTYGVWALLAFVVFRWYRQEVTNRTGPHYLKNGAAEELTDKLGHKVGKAVADEIGTRLVGPLARQAMALEEVARELLDSRLCPFTPRDAERIAEQHRRKQDRAEEIKRKHMEGTLTSEELDKIIGEEEK